MNEFELIEYIKDHFDSKYIGDDAFFYDNLLISKDILIEDVHFILKNNFYEIGAKSLISNISDILAMGGEAKFFFLGLGIPSKITFNNLKEFFNGVKFISHKYNVTLGGGDLSKSGNKFFISVTITGKPFGKIITRANAEVNDSIYVIGELGDVEIGLRVIKNNFSVANKEYFIKKHYIKDLYPQIVKELTQLNIINSMIDISDGFLQDLEHILKSSNKSAEIYVKNIPVSDNFLQLKDILKEEFFIIPLISGEEYSLIFTSNEKYDKKIKQVATKFDVKITKVGKIVEKREQLIIFKDFKINLDKKGYTHF